MSSPKQIVVIGGGYIGIQFAQDLAKLVPASSASITVIEKNDFTFHCMGVPRALIDPTYVNKLFIPLTNALVQPHSKIIRGIAESIQDKEIVVRKITNDTVQDTTTLIPFDYLVLATGSTGAPSIKVAGNEYTRSNVESAFNDLASRVKASPSILIVGGGPVGIEIAGEIKTAYPDKSVTIIDAHDKLVSNSNTTEKFRNTLASRLNDINVKVILGERLEERLTAHGFEKKTLRTDKGTSIESDLQILCGGLTPNVDLIRKLDPTLIAPNATVRVAQNLQLEDARFKNIFAIGDVNNHPTPKLAYTGAIQGNFLAKQLANVIKNGGGNIAPYVVSGPEGMLVPLGPYGGVAQLPFFGGCVVGDWVVRFVKARDYFAGKMWGTWNAPLP